ncbi:MAG: class D sortase [Anaerobacillus sp.]|uniref:class D sortase n=1 Tax=Anaerobacillus sp. TaxID=1872506 RepID=UPI00391C589E
MLLKWLTRLFLIAGLSIVAYSGYMIWDGNKQVSDTLTEAKDLVSEPSTPSKFNPKLNDVIGIISIPKLDKDLPILIGTEDEQLNRGVGHYVGTKFPGENGQILLSGHRDTVFRGLGDLLHGDEIKLDVEYGSFSYEIVNTYIVDADDTSVIDFNLDEEVLVLSTCYPFSYVGNAPQRYIIEAKPTKQ